MLIVDANVVILTLLFFFQVCHVAQRYAGDGESCGEIYLQLSVSNLLRLGLDEAPETARLTTRSIEEHILQSCKPPDSI